MEQVANDEFDFDSWIENYKPEEISYYAIYDPSSFKVIGIYPKGPAEDKANKIKIETIIAEEIISGKIGLSSLTVNVEDEELIVSEQNYFTKSDTIFYRLKSSSEDLVKANLTVIYYRSDNKIVFSISSNLRKQKEKYIDSKENFLFYLTDSNDPNKLFHTVEIPVEKLFELDQLEFNVEIEKEKFSVFTKKVFNNYYFSIR
jgi:hypothetical protein